MSCKRNFAYTLLLAVVVISMLAGMGVVIGIVLSAQNPMMDMTFPPPTYQPLINSLLSEMCPPAPQESLVMFRESCEVSYPNATVANTSVFNRGSCSDALCSTAEGVCSSGSRCCCQDFVVSQVNYSCPNYNRVTPVGIDIVEECGCQQCNVSTVFIGRVTDQMGIPLIVTNITVGGTDSYITNEFGLFVFAVPAEQESIAVSVSPVQYLAFQRTYRVIPGGIRILNIVLKELLIVTFRPPEGDFYQSAFSLEVVSNQANLSAGESSVRYPSGSFTNDTDYTFVGVPIRITPADIEALNLAFSTTTTGSGKRKSKGSSLLKARIQGEKMVRQSGSGGDGTVLLSTASVGILMIADEDGIPFAPSTEGQPFVIGSIFDSQLYSTAELNELTLYIRNQTSQEFYRASNTPNVTDLGSGTQLVEFTIYDVSFPLYYIVAFEEPSVCYVAVRAFDPSISSNMSEIGTSVRVITKQGDVVNAVYAQTAACVLIPCTGNLTLQVAEDEGLYLPEEISTTISSQFGDGAIYLSLRACAAIGLVSTNPSEYFSFTLNSSLLLTSPPLPIGLESPPFCILKVEVTATVGSTVDVVVLLPTGIMVLERIAATANDGPTTLEQEFGSGFANSTEQTACLWIPCSSEQVTVTATVAETSEVCLPLQGRATSSTGNLDLLQNVANPASFDFTFQVPADTSSVVGIQRSEDWAELAYYKCLIQEDIGIAFQCIPT